MLWKPTKKSRALAICICAGFQLFSNLNYFNSLFSMPLRTLPFASKVCR